MKTKTLLIAFVACLFVHVLTSCTKFIDAQLTAFEKSINKLETNYKDLSPQSLEKAVSLLQSQFEELENIKDTEMTINQKKRFRKLKVNYFTLLVKIKTHVSLSNVFDSRDGKSVIDYLDELTNVASSNVLVE